MGGVPPVGRTRLLCAQGFGVVAENGLPFDWLSVFDEGASTPQVVPGVDPVPDRDAGLGAGMKRVTCRGRISGPCLGRTWAATGVKS
jgi:hypothetical protein